MGALNGGIVMANFMDAYINDDPDAASVWDVVRHINHIRNVSGVEHVGIGSDFCGAPILIAALIEDESQEWTNEELGMLASGNIIRVMRDVEAVRDMLAAEGEEPYQTWIPDED